MQDRPTASELLVALREFLDDEVLPAVDGPTRYRTRVASNLVSIVERELTLGPATLRREQELLTDLVGVDAGQLGADLDVEDQVLELNRRLTERLADPNLADPDFDAAARDALERIVRDKLAVARPGYDRYDSAAELEADR